MGATRAADSAFVPKVWSDHIQAYFNRKLALGQLALIDKTLTGAPGETVNFPFYKQIGDVQEPAEDEGLAVDRLQDDAFAVTVKEVGKAVGWKDKSHIVSAQKDPEGEAQRQMAIKFAEKVDKDIISTINTAGAYKDGFVATGTSDTCKVSKILQSKITGFGDRQDEAVAIAMHSQDFLNMMTDSTAGFLQGNSLDPFWQAPGFMGRLLGMAVFVLDTMPEVNGGIAGKKAYQHFIFKANPYGIYMKQDLMPEKDRDILHRENIVTATMWYGVLGLHAKVASNDYRVTRGAFVTSLSA